ncbi:sporulation protein Cse60, partial [Streptococcus pneumoniae]|nr:sporulation protein Cse60 [Streptococcus pneumoniae]
MIKTVFFSCDYPHHEAIDDQINSWLAENPGIKLIDIKFQSNVSAVADSGVSAEYW